MNDEIKEILECLKEEDNYWSKQEHNYAFPDYYSLNREDLHLLLDYITNLQQKNERLKENNGNMQEEMARTWEENERLKEDLKGQGNLTLSYCKSEQDYKSRCEKAIEYICRKDMEANLKGNAEFKSKDLINILQNGSDSQ